MTPFEPSKAFQQVRAESQRQREAAGEIARRTQEKWAAEGRRAVACLELINILPCDNAGGTADIARATALMVEYAQTLPLEGVKDRVTFVSERLAKLAADGEHVPDAVLKKILLHLLLVASQGDQEKVAEVFTEGLRGDPNDVQAFRWCLVNWLMDKVVDGLRPLPVEVIRPVEAPAQSEDGQEPVNFGAIPVDSVICDTFGAGPEKGRLHFDPQTQTVTLDGKPHKIEDPKAFSLYREIASSCPNPLTKAILQERVPGCRGDKKIRHLLNSLPEPLCDTVPSGPNGYWLDLNPPPNHRKRARRQKGRT